MALAVRFPVNITIGIPIYFMIVQYIYKLKETLINSTSSPLSFGRELDQPEPWFFLKIKFEFIAVPISKLDFIRISETKIDCLILILNLNLKTTKK